MVTNIILSIFYTRFFFQFLHSYLYENNLFHVKEKKWWPQNSKRLSRYRNCHWSQDWFNCSFYYLPSKNCQWKVVKAIWERYRWLRRKRILIVNVCTTLWSVSHFQKNLVRFMRSSCNRYFCSRAFYCRQRSWILIEIRIGKYGDIARAQSECRANSIPHCTAARARKFRCQNIFRVLISPSHKWQIGSWPRTILNCDIDFELRIL